jgi:hypothetical protein
MPYNNLDFYRSISYKPKEEAVKNASLKTHFVTIHRQDFVPKEMVKKKPKKKKNVFNRPVVGKTNFNWPLGFFLV